MGGEWDKMSIMEEAEVIAISGDDGIDRIFPPKEFRETIITSMHQGGKPFAIFFRHLQSVLQVARYEVGDQESHI